MQRNVFKYQACASIGNATKTDTYLSDPLSVHLRCKSQLLSCCTSRNPPSCCVRRSICPSLERILPKKVTGSTKCCYGRQTPWPALYYAYSIKKNELSFSMRLQAAFDRAAHCDSAPIHTLHVLSLFLATFQKPVNGYISNSVHSLS